MIDLFKECPSLNYDNGGIFSKSTISYSTVKASYNPIDIDKWNGKFVKTEFDSDLYIFGYSKFETKETKGDYKGMIDKFSGKPSGFGRLIKNDKSWCDDGQFKDGDWCGYARVLR